MIDTPRSQSSRVVWLAAVTLFAVLLFAAATAGTAAADTTDVSSCTTIQTNGTYELTGNVTADDTDTCIRVTASNVTIDGNGYTIHGFDNNTYEDNGDPDYINGSTGVNVTGSNGDHIENVTIRNLTVEDGNAGINARYGHDLTLRNVTVHHTDKQAIATFRTNGTVALHNITVTESATWLTTTDGEYVDYGSRPAVDIGQMDFDPGELGVGVTDDHYVDEVVISNLTAIDNGHWDSFSDDGTVNVYADGPVTVTDSLVEGAAGGGISVATPPADYGGLDATLTNVTVREFNKDVNESYNILGGGPGVYVSVEGEVTVRNSTVANGSENGPGFDVDGGRSVTFTNNSVEDVKVDDSDLSAVMVGSGDGEATVRDVQIRGSGNSSGLSAFGGFGINVRNVVVTDTADKWGYAASLGSGEEGDIRNVTVRDSGDGGLSIDVLEDLDARDISVSDVGFQDDGGLGEPFENGEGLIVNSYNGIVRDVEVTDTAGGVRIEEDNSNSPVFYPSLAVENLNVANTSHHGIEVFGDDIEFDGVTVENTSKTGVVKRPGVGDADIQSGEFVVDTLTITGAGTDGIAARAHANSLPNDNVTLRNVSITESGDAGVAFHNVSESTLQDVSVTDSGGVDLNLTRASTTLAGASLSGTAFNGTVSNVTVESLDPADARQLPSHVDHVGVFFRATETHRNGYFDATVGYQANEAPAGLDETTLQLWRDDGERWSAVGGTNDPGADTVSKNLTYFSTFAPLGTDGPDTQAANFSVNVTDVDDPVWTGVPVTVTVTVTNERSTSDTQEVQLLDFERNVVASESVQLAGGASRSVDLQWTLDNASQTTRTVAVRSEHGWDTAPVEMSPVAGDRILDCGVVSESGSYDLGRNITLGSDTGCIDVEASNVTIDGDGYTITGPIERGEHDGGTGILIDAENGATANVTVRNVTIRNVSVAVGTQFDDAVQFDDADTLTGLTVENVSSPFVEGVGVSGSVGDGSTLADVTVTDSTFEGSSAGGVFLGGSASDATVSDVEVSNVSVDDGDALSGYGVAVTLDDDGVIENVTVTDVAVRAENEGVEVEIDDEESVVRNLSVADNDLYSEDAATVRLIYDHQEAAIDGVTVEDNRLHSDGTEVGVLVEGDAPLTRTADFSVRRNGIDNVSDGVVVTVREYTHVGNVTIAANEIGTDGYGVEIDATDGEDDPRLRGLDVRNNTVTGAYTGVQVEVDGDDGRSNGVSVADNDLDVEGTGIELDIGGENTTHAGARLRNNSVAGAEIGMEFEFWGTGVAYDASVRGNDLTSITATGMSLTAQTTPDADVTVSQNTIRNETGTPTGIAVQTEGSGVTDNGSLLFTRNTITTGGDAVAVNREAPGEGPVDSIEITYNVLNASGAGVENHNTAGDGEGRSWVNATNNYWNASDGPDSPDAYADPVTGTPADGSGAAVSNGSDAGTANVHFDPYLQSATPQVVFVTVESTTPSVTEGEALAVTVSVENADDEQTTQSLTLSAGGVERTSTEVTLDAGESITETLTWDTAFGDAGNYNVTVASENDTDTAPVAVEPATGNFSVTLDSTTGPVSEGDQLTVNATVENVGDLQGEQSVSLAVDGTERDTTTLTLASGASANLTLTWQTGPGDAGSHEVAVGSGNDSDGTAVTVQQRYATEYGINRTYQQMAGDSFFTDVAAMGDGGFVMVGSTESGDYLASTNASVVNVDASGNEVWSRVINTTAEESFAAVASTDDGGVLAVGEREDSALAVRFGPDGAVQWTRTYAASEEHAAFTDVVTTADGGFALVGSRTTPGNGGIDDGWVLKLNASGSAEWNRTIGGIEASDGLSSINRTSDAGYVVAGDCSSCTDDYAGNWILKLTASGSIEWNTTFGRDMAEDVNAVRQTADGGYVVAGSAVRAESGALEDAWLVKFDATGAEQWQRNYYPDTDSYERWHDVRQLSNGDFLLVGATDGIGDGDDEGWIMRVDDRGYERANWTVPRYSEDEFMAMTTSASGDGIAVAGHSRSRNRGYAGWLLEVEPGVPVAGNMSVTSIETNTPVAAGERLNVTATVENTGGAETTRTVTLTIDGQQRDSAAVTLSGGESTEVALAWDTAPADDGTYTVEVAVGDSTASETVTVETVTGTISGTVTDAETGSTLENATVRVLDAENPALVPGHTTTAPDGTYTIEVPVDDYDVRVEAEGYVPKQVPASVSENATTPVDVQLTPEDGRDDGNDSDRNDTAGEPSILASSVTHVGGAQPEMANISVAASVSEEIATVRLRNDTVSPESPAAREYGAELGGLGADATTEFEIELRVANYTPRLLLGAGNVEDWSVEHNGDGTTNVTVQVRPISVQLLVDCETYGEPSCMPTLEDWPSGANDTATRDADASVQLSAMQLGLMENTRAEQLNGTVVATDAQRFVGPQYKPPGVEPGELTFQVAGPHYTTDGDVNQGFYEVTLPSALLDEWNVSDGGDLTVTYRGNTTTFDTEPVDDGLRVSVDLNYSAGAVVISHEDDDEEADTTAPTITAVSVSDATDGDGTVVPGDEVLISANVTDASGISTVTADASGFGAGTVELTAADGDSYTKAVTVTSDAVAGDQFITVNATDTAGNGGQQAVASAETLAVDTAPEAFFAVSIDEVNTSVTVGESVVVNYTVTNTGTAGGSQNVTFTVNGTQTAVNTGVLLDTGASVTDTFTYTTADGDVPAVEVTVGSENDTATRTVPVESTGGDDTPTAVDDSYTVTAGETLSVSESDGVLSADTDPAGDELTASLVAGPSNGTVTLQANGSFEYTPDAGFTGTDSFTYEATDADGNADQATVTITVDADDAPAPDPVNVETGAVTPSDSGATFNGTLTELGDASSATVYFVYWQPDIPDERYWWTGNSVSSPTEFNATVNLSAGTEYVVRAYARSADGEWIAGESVQFTTAGTVYGVETRTPTHVGVESATLRGDITGLGTADNATTYVTYWETGSKASTLTWWTGSAQSTPGNFTANVSLEAGTNYTVQALTQSPDGRWQLGETVQFTTEGDRYAVETGSADNVSTGSAELGGTLTGLGAADNATVYVTYWEEGRKSETRTWWTGSPQNSAGNFTANVSLAAGTTYEYRAWAKTDDGTWTAGEVRNVTTSGTKFTVQTNTPTIPSSGNATLRGALDGTGDASSATVYLVYWEEGNRSETETWVTGATYTNGTTFSANVTGLSTNTTYVVRAYAQDSTGAWKAGRAIQFTAETS